MLAMKGTQGTTFNWGANYWTTNNTLNPSDTTRNNADAKFHTFNYFPATDWLAIFPDTGINGGDLPASLNTGWAWYEPNAVNVSIPVSTWYSLSLQITKLAGGTAGYFGTNPQPKNSVKFIGGVWSSQVGFQWYGINYFSSTATPANLNSVRWGWGWNNESDQSSNDVIGGIGINRTLASAGDYIHCCQDVTGLNRQMRFEWYVR
jgi:hypothetical protein